MLVSVVVWVVWACVLGLAFVGICGLFYGLWSLMVDQGDDQKLSLQQQQQQQEQHWRQEQEQQKWQQQQQQPLDAASEDRMVHQTDDFQLLQSQHRGKDFTEAFVSRMETDVMYGLEANVGWHTYCSYLEANTQHDLAVVRHLEPEPSPTGWNWPVTNCLISSLDDGGVCAISKWWPVKQHECDRLQSVLSNDWMLHAALLKRNGKLITLAGENYSVADVDDDCIRLFCTESKRTCLVLASKRTLMVCCSNGDLVSLYCRMKRLKRRFAACDY